MISWRIKTDRPPDLPPSRTARLAWRLVIGLLVVVLGAFLLIWLAFHKLGGAETSISRLQHGARQLYSQAVTAGASPVTTPPGAPPASRVNPQIGPQGDRGPGPTAGQIADAVDAYCAVAGQSGGAGVLRGRRVPRTGRPHRVERLERPVGCARTVRRCRARADQRPDR
jgi:hypothetical protein